MDNCKHVYKLRLSPFNSVLNPEKWHCSVCATTESIWACLHCSNVACGRYENEHALTHFKQNPTHFLAIEVNERYVFCYECDEYVLNDNAAGDLKLLRNSLLAASSLDASTIAGNNSNNNNGSLSANERVLRPRRRDPVQLFKEDRNFTALWIRRYHLQESVFSAWRYVTPLGKKAIDTKRAQERAERRRQKRHLERESRLPSRVRHSASSKNDLIKRNVTSSKSSSTSQRSSRGRRLRQSSRTSKKRRAILPGVTGLRNLGNTCYMNSILQVLSNVSTVRDFFLDWDMSRATQILSQNAAVSTFGSEMSNRKSLSPSKVTPQIPFSLEKTVKNDDIIDNNDTSKDKNNDNFSTIINDNYGASDKISQNQPVRPSSITIRSLRKSETYSGSLSEPETPSGGPKLTDFGDGQPAFLFNDNKNLKMKSSRRKSSIDDASILERPNYIRQTTQDCFNYVSDEKLLKFLMRHQPKNNSNNNTGKNSLSKSYSSFPSIPVSTSTSSSSVNSSTLHSMSIPIFGGGLNGGSQGTSSNNSHNKSKHYQVSSQKVNDAGDAPPSRPRKIACRRLSSTRSTCTPNTVSIGWDLHALFRVIWSGKWAMVSPQAMLGAVWTWFPSFRGFKQQDAQEFLCELMDKLDTELDYFGCQHRPPCDFSRFEEINNGNPIITLSFRLPHQPTEKFSCTAYMSRLFEGTLQSTVTCDNCGTSSQRIEKFMDLSLEFPERFQTRTTRSDFREDSCHLTELLSKFTAKEKLDGGKIYECAKCNLERRRSRFPRLTEAHKRLLVAESPHILRLHLKRFRWSGRNDRLKIHTHVQFDSELDLIPFILVNNENDKIIDADYKIESSNDSSYSDTSKKDSSTMNAGEKFYLNDDDDSRDEISNDAAKVNDDSRQSSQESTKSSEYNIDSFYRLAAVVVHHGRGFSSGHYTAYCWNDTANGWVHCNDSKVSTTTLETVMASQAYILLYVRSKRPSEKQPLPSTVPQQNEEKMNKDESKKIPSVSFDSLLNEPLSTMLLQRQDSTERDGVSSPSSLSSLSIQADDDTKSTKSSSTETSTDTIGLITEPTASSDVSSDAKLSTSPLDVKLTSFSTPRVTLEKCLLPQDPALLSPRRLRSTPPKKVLPPEIEMVWNVPSSKTSSQSDRRSFHAYTSSPIKKSGRDKDVPLVSIIENTFTTDSYSLRSGDIPRYTATPTTLHVRHKSSRLLSRSYDSCASFLESKKFTSTKTGTSSVNTHHANMPTLMTATHPSLSTTTSRQHQRANDERIREDTSEDIVHIGADHHHLLHRRRKRNYSTSFPTNDDDDDVETLSHISEQTVSSVDGTESATISSNESTVSSVTSSSTSSSTTEYAALIPRKRRRTETL